MLFKIVNCLNAHVTYCVFRPPQPSTLNGTLNELNSKVVM